MKSISSVLRFGCVLTVVMHVIICTPVPSSALSSANIPLDSPIYSYLDKLAGFGLISGDIKGIKPFSKAEGARLLLEAEKKFTDGGEDSRLAGELIRRVRELIPREVVFRKYPDKHVPKFDYNPVSSLRVRYLWLDGAPRDYSKLKTHDPGNDGVFGIGSGLRPKGPPDKWVMQRGSEGTPLLENNNGIVYENGHTGEVRWGSEWYLSNQAVLLIEPLVLAGEDASARLNRGYLKLGGGALELEAGKDEDWLGLGYRGNITLTNNAENFTQVKLSSPEPVYVPYIGAIKYALIASRFENTVVDGVERQPWYYAAKLSAKPLDNLEFGFNLGRQVGGPGVNNRFGDTLRGLIGGTSADNSNSMAGFEARYRIPWLRNSELYGEFSGEDSALFWPIVESYVAGIYIPRLTDEGRNDFRFEFFQGNQILYRNITFPNGYIYKNMPIGHSQGGATQDYFFRFSHWFSARNNLALEYIYTNRGTIGPVAGQPIERKHAGRFLWCLPLSAGLDALLGYGIEKVANLNLMEGADVTNQLLRLELRYRY